MFEFFRRRRRKHIIIRVRTEKRAAEIIDACEARGFNSVIFGIEPDKPEDISDFKKYVLPVAPIPKTRTPHPNDFCPCESGRSYRKCCGRDQQAQV